MKLTDLKPDRMLTLGTQMKWRIQEGNGEAFYELGVSDNGKLKGLSILEVNESIENIINISKMYIFLITRIKASVLFTRNLCISPEKETNKKYICEVKVTFEHNLSKVR